MRRPPGRLVAVVSIVVPLPAALGVTGAAASAASAAAPPGGCPTPAGALCVGRADGGRTIHVRVGQTIRVDLGGSGLDWSRLHQVGPHLLRRHGPVARHTGVLGATYVGASAGRTALQASGAPHCASGQACPQFIIFWRVRVVVG